MKSNIIVIGLLSVLTAIAVCVVLNVSRGIVVPLVIALLMIQACKPIMDFNRRLNVPYAVNICLVFAFIFFLFFVGVRLGIGQLAQSGRVFDQYGHKLTELMNSVFETLEIPLESFSIVGLLRTQIGNISGGVLSVSNYFFLTLIFLMFMLFEAPVLNQKIEAAFPDGGSERINRIIESISSQTSRYLGVMVIVSLATGICVWASLAVLGVEFAVGWGVLAFVLNFVPTIGSVIASVPPILMAALQFGPTSGKCIAAIVLVVFFQAFIGNVIAPKMLGDSLGLSPVVVMLSLLLWGQILGIAGAILSVPIAAVIKIVCENVPLLHPIAIMMGTGRAAEKKPPEKKPPPAPNRPIATE